MTVVRVVKISFPCCPLSAAVLVHQKDLSLSKYISSFSTKLKRPDFSFVLLCKRPNVSVWLKDEDAKWSYERNPLRSNSNKPQVQFLCPGRPGESYGTASEANKSFQAKRRLIKWGPRMLKLNSSFSLCDISNTFLPFYHRLLVIFRCSNWLIAPQKCSYNVCICYVYMWIN